MTKTMEYMESIRELTAKKSWYAVANLLETSEINISRIRKGTRHPSNEMCFRIAELLELEPSEVIAAIEMEASKDEEKKEFWKNHFFQHGRVAGIAILALCINSFYNEQATASETLANGDSVSNLSESVIMRSTGSEIFGHLSALIQNILPSLLWYVSRTLKSLAPHHSAKSIVC